MIPSIDLTGRVAVVTGGSRGIGRAVALGLANAGADVAVTSRDAAACETVAGEIRALGRRALAVGCDVSEDSALVALFEKVKADLGDTAVLVCCAGQPSVAAAESVERAELLRMMQIGYLGATRAAQLALPQMKAGGGGAIVFVSSVWGLGGQPQSLAYGAAKAAIIQTMKVTAIEWARYGIRVNAVAPGFVDTDMTAGMAADVRERLLRRVPLRRAATVDEVAGPTVFLCSDLASYVTGHVLVIDGGERAR